MDLNYLKAQLARISNELDKLYANSFQSDFVFQIYEGNHPSYECQWESSFYPLRYEQEYYVSYYQHNITYLNTYNFKWKNHLGCVLELPPYAPHKETSLEEMIGALTWKEKRIDVPNSWCILRI